MKACPNQSRSQGPAYAAILQLIFLCHTLHSIVLINCNEFYLINCEPFTLYSILILIENITDALELTFRLVNRELNDIFSILHTRLVRLQSFGLGRFTTRTHSQSPLCALIRQLLHGMTLNVYSIEISVLLALLLIQLISDKHIAIHLGRE